jgi:hypothetical protein
MPKQSTQELYGSPQPECIAWIIAGYVRIPVEVGR